MVGFRYQAKYAADDLGLTGWVCNLCDGRVEMEVQGRDSDIDRLLARLYEARSIRITDIEARRNRLLKGESSCKDTEQLRVRKENVRCSCRFDKDGCKQTVIW